MSIDRPDYSRIIDMIRFDTGVQQRQNLILNGSFETGDFSNWLPTGNVSIDTTLILHGRYSCRLAPVASSIAQLLPPWYADHTKFSFWMYNAVIAANMLQVELGFVDGTSETHNITPTGSGVFAIYAIESATHKQLCYITFLHNHATDILHLEGISGVLKTRPVVPAPGSEIEVTQDTAEDLNTQAILKPISCAAVHEQYAKGVGDSPVTILTTPAGKQAIVYYYTIWNNDDANDADVCLFIGDTTCPLFSGHLDPDCGVIANLVRPVKGADGADVILTIAGSTDVDCIVHAEVVPFVDCMLEGEYSDWTEKWSVVPLADTPFVYVSWDEPKGYVYVGRIGSEDMYRVLLSDGTQSIIISSHVGEMSRRIANSVLGKYYVGVDFSGATCVVRVVKGGAVVKSINTPNNLGTVDAFFSPSGRYLLILDRQADTLKLFGGS